MTPAFTLVLPHRRNPGNDDALAICLDCLARNTVNEFKLIMDAAYDSPLYPRVNAMVAQVDTEYFIYWASDFFAAPGWDVPMAEAAQPDTIITNIVVEPGAIGIHDLNLRNDFGRKPDTFRRQEFEDWSLSPHAPMLDGEGWFAPYLMHTQAFLDFGGIRDGLTPDDQGFSAGDEDFFQRWKASGRQVKRVKSYVYHLQRWSEISEQTKGNRG